MSMMKEFKEFDVKGKEAIGRETDRTAKNCK